MGTILVNMKADICSHSDTFKILFINFRSSEFDGHLCRTAIYGISGYMCTTEQTLVLGRLMMVL